MKGRGSLHDVACDAQPAGRADGLPLKLDSVAPAYEHAIRWRDARWRRGRQGADREAAIREDSLGDAGVAVCDQRKEVAAVMTAATRFASRARLRRCAHARRWISLCERVRSCNRLGKKRDWS